MYKFIHSSSQSELHTKRSFIVSNVYVGVATATGIELYAEHKRIFKFALKINSELVTQKDWVNNKKSIKNSLNYIFTNFSIKGVAC